MSFQRLSKKLEQDFSYLMWRARTHHQSGTEVSGQFAEMASNYRRLVAAEELDQMEKLIESYQAKI